MKKRVLSLLLCFVLAAGLLSVCAPPAQAGTIAGAFEQFIKQPGQIKKLFGNEVAHGDCGPAGDEASVHYKIYEVTNPTVVQDNPFLQQIWQIHDYREDAQYYGVYIFGDGPMADYAVKGQKAPWMGNVEVTEYNDKGQKLGTTVVENLGEDYLVLAYIAGATDEEWNGRTEHYTGVTNVGNCAFKDCQYLTCMFLNDDITTIGDHAFYADEYLSAINMPRDLELIDKYAFYGCDTLTFVRAGACSRLRRIEDHAFYSCTMLAELRLPNGLTYIGPWAFAWDRILGQEDTTLGLPSSLQTIGTGAFAFVNHHKNLNIPANVTSIGDYAFMCDYYMNNLTFSPGDKPLTIGVAAFFGDNHMKTVDLSNRVAQIDKCAFAGCEMLEEAYFGDKINTIQDRAFTSLDNAMKILVEGVLNGILRPDDTDQNADQAGDISTAFNMIAKITKLKRAVFKNDPAKSIYGAADSNRSFPDDCVVYYTQDSHTWAAELKDDGTWQGYKTGLWHGDHIAQFADTVVAPTCTEQGYTHHVCTVKGCTYAPVDDTYVAYIRSQFDHAIHQLEEISGKKFDEKKFEQACANANRTAKAWLKVCDYLQYKPAPYSGFDLFNHMADVVTARGKVAAAEAFEQLAVDLEEAIKTGHSTTPFPEKYRVMFEGIPCWPKLPALFKPLKANGINVTAVVYAPAFGFVYNGMEEMVRAYCKAPNSVCIEQGVDWREGICRANKVDGVLVHYNRSCKPWSGYMAEMQRRFTKDLGIPTAGFDGDQADPRNFNAAQYETRVQGLVEAMQANEKKEEQ